MGRVGESTVCDEFPRYVLGKASERPKERGLEEKFGNEEGGREPFK